MADADEQNSIQNLTTGMIRSPSCPPLYKGHQPLVEFFPETPETLYLTQHQDHHSHPFPPACTSPPTMSAFVNSQHTAKKTNPYRNSRLTPADGSFRNALSKEECDAANDVLAAADTLPKPFDCVIRFPYSLGEEQFHSYKAKYWHLILQGIATKVCSTGYRVEHFFSVLFRPSPSVPSYCFPYVGFSCRLPDPYRPFLNLIPLFPFHLLLPTSLRLPLLRSFPLLLPSSDMLISVDLSFLTKLTTNLH
jgi:hypothetical protein